MARDEQGSEKGTGGKRSEPIESTISNNTYPYVSEIYAALRSDIDKSSNAYKLFEYLITASGQKVVKESGYVPIDNQR